MRERHGPIDVSGHREVRAAPVWGAAAAVVSAPVAAALVGSAYRFPVPFMGYARGPSAAGNAALGSVFYVMLGGALVLAVAGAAAGWWVRRVVVASSKRVVSYTVGLAFVAALIGALTLALLEFVIGPW